MTPKVYLVSFSLLTLCGRLIQTAPFPQDDSMEMEIEDSGIKCPHRAGPVEENKENFLDWEFYHQPGDSPSNISGTQTPAALTFLDMDEEKGPTTPPYDTEDMIRDESVFEEDTSYLQSEWRQNWTRKTDEEKFEEVLQHAKRKTLVNWYQHGLQQWGDLEKLKLCVAKKECDPSKLHEPIEVAEVRLNKALKTLAKYIAKFQYGEATGEKTM